MKLAYAVGPLALVFAMIVACGSDGDGGGNGTSGGTSGSNGASGGLFGGNGNGDGGNGNGNGGDPNCNAPVDMYIMFDRSGSMARDTGDGAGDSDLDCNIGENKASKWCRAINALSGYFKSQGSANQAAALQFFPLDSHNTSKCNTGDDYNVAALPASGFQTLPSDSFDAKLNEEAPDTGGGTPGTPTEGAIRGLTRFTEANRRPGRVTIGILITDGNPRNLNGSGCETNLDDLAQLLRAHHDATKVRTYVIGMEGASEDNLETLAEGGDGPIHDSNVSGASNTCSGAAQCRHWNVGNGDPAVFTAVLAAIQQSADGCKEGGGFVNPVK